MPESIQAYLEAVRTQIRWKRARPVLAQELEQHLEDQRDSFVLAGNAPEEAERLAVQDMGDPVTVGTELDRVHRPRPQWGLLGMTIALAAAGVFLRVIFDNPYADRTMGLIRTLTALGLGTAAMLGMYFLDVSRLVRHTGAVYIAALFTPALLYVIPYSYYAFVTSALYPLVYALWLYSFRRKGWRGLTLAVLGGVPLTAVCCLVPNSSALLLLLFCGLTLTLYAAGQDWFHVGRWKGMAATLAAALLFPAFLISRGYLNSFFLRVMVALRPELDREGLGFMGWMLKLFWEDLPPLRRVSGEAAMAVNAGARVFGSGQELRPVDFSQDFLPASMAVAWGWVPLALLLTALTVLLIWLLVKGLRQSYLPGRLVVLAVAMTLGFQILFSMALNFGFVLFSASLPLIVGNLQTVVDMALIGLALSVFRGDSIAREEPEGPRRSRKRPRIRLELQ